MVVLPSHQEAIPWYLTRDLPLPSDCMVPGSPPEPLAESTGSSGIPTWKATPFVLRFSLATGRLPVASKCRTLVSRPRPAAAQRLHGAGDSAEAAGGVGGGTEGATGHSDPPSFER
jgi:hypothetical protein